MTVTISIQCENAAFEEPDSGRELARILRQLAEQFEDGQVPGTLRDVNGNTVGEVSIFD